MCDGVQTEAQLSDEATSHRSGFDEFAAIEFAQIVALGVALLRDEDEALDVAQETMARALQDWSDIGVMDRPGAWARRVALNLVTDALRARSRRWRLHRRLAAERRVTALVGDDLWDRGFWDHVAALPRRQRDVVVLFYVDDLSVAEIADIVGVPTGTVKSDLSRARNRLRTLLSGGSE